MSLSGWKSISKKLLGYTSLFSLSAAWRIKESLPHVCLFVCFYFVIVGKKLIEKKINKVTGPMAQ